MTRLALLLLAPLLASAAASAPVPKPESDADRVAKLLGKATYPEKGCRFLVSVTGDGNTVTAHLPKARVGSPEDYRLGMLTEKPVVGDFELTVRLRTTAPVQPLQGKIMPAYRGLGGGLVAWQSDGPGQVTDVAVCRWFVRDRPNRNGPHTWTERATANYPGTHFHLTDDDSADVQRPRFLRLTRSGTSVVTATSDDGKTWQERVSKEVAFGKTVNVGLWAFNFTEDAADVVFEQFSLRPLK